MIMGIGMQSKYKNIERIVCLLLSGVGWVNIHALLTNERSRIIGDEGANKQLNEEPQNSINCSFTCFISDFLGHVFRIMYLGL